MVPTGQRCALDAVASGSSRLAFYAVPVETFTFLFTDIQGSTTLLGRVGEGVYGRVLADHHSIIRSGIAAHGGREVDTQGDAFFAVFSSPAACLAAVVQMQQALQGHAWPGGEQVRVRMGVHTGQASQTATGLVGLDVHRAARVAAAGHGGQVLLSEASAALVREALPPGATLEDLGVHRLKDLDRPERIFQLRAADLPGEFPPLQTVPGGVAAATRTLPRDLASFTGRRHELGELVAAAAGAGGVVGIHAIDGMAGIGKTTLAVHAAHRLADRFPDGQFFLPLHAHTPGQRPVEPADALASLLLTAGVPAQLIPHGLEARAGRWRDVVAGKKILLRLDDAAGHEQVRPLLPGTAGSLVLLTSRRRLAALEDAAVISLDTLPAREAAQLLARLAGRADLAAGDGPAGQITRLCGYLPLAIGMIAGQLRHHPAWTAAALAADLGAARDRLALMHAENLSVAAAFDLSYADLAPGRQRLFRRLGLVPGPSVDAYAAAALDGITVDTARRYLDDLYDQHLLTEPAPGRYQLHDLVREHARALAAADDPAGSGAAVGRLLDYYLHAAAAAGAHFASWIGTGRRPPPGGPPAEVPDLSAASQATVWLEAERASLHATVDYAATNGQYPFAVQIPAAMSGFLAARGPWDQSRALHQTALAAALESADQLGQATALAELGVLGHLTGNYPAAIENLVDAAALYGDIGDLPHQAYALTYLGFMHRLTGDWDAATAHYRRALTLARRAADRRAEAEALNNLGEVQHLTGDYPAAAASQQLALGLNREAGNRHGQALALNDLGMIWQETGDYARSAESQQQALDLFRDVGDRLGEAVALNDLGVLQRETGDYPAAEASHRKALEIFRDLGNLLGQAEALNRLGELSSQTSATSQAREQHTRALAIARDIGVPSEEARALEGLGRSHLRDGNPGQAARQLRQALGIYQRIGAHAARRVRQTLDDHGLTATEPRDAPSSEDQPSTSPAPPSGSR
jgi:class 3 adenylate cyclase/tetratricopeptide (TPR) repeat protein